MTNINTQIALNNVRTNRRKATMTPAQKRRHTQLERMQRYIEARKTNRFIYQQITDVVKGGGSKGADVQNIIDLVNAKYGVSLSERQVYDGVFAARKKGLIKPYNSAYFA